MSTNEIFDLLYLDFKDKFHGGDRVFTQKYIVSLQQIRIYQLKESSKIDIIKALKCLNELQEKYAYHHYWSIFLKDI